MVQTLRSRGSLLGTALLLAIAIAGCGAGRQHGRSTAKAAPGSAAPAATSADAARPGHPVHRRCVATLPAGASAELSKAPPGTLMWAVIPALDDKLTVAVHEEGDKRRFVVRSCNGEVADTGDEGFPAGGRARPKLTRRVPIGDGRLAVQVQTGEEDGAPEATIHGFVALLRRSGREVIATAVRPLGKDEAEIAAVKRIGDTPVLVVRQYHLGTGGGESADGQCLLELDALAQLICVTTSSSKAFCGDPIAVSTNAEIRFGRELVISETTEVSPGLDQEEGKKVTFASVLVQVTTRYRLEGGALSRLAR